MIGLQTNTSLSTKERRSLSYLCLHMRYISTRFTTWGTPQFWSKSNDATVVEPDDYTTLDEPFNVLFELAVNANMDDPLGDGALDEMGKPWWTKEGVGQGTSGYNFKMDINRPNAQANMHKEHFKQVGSDVDRVKNKDGRFNPISAPKKSLIRLKNHLFSLMGQWQEKRSNRLRKLFYDWSIRLKARRCSLVEIKKPSQSSTSRSTNLSSF